MTFSVSSPNRRARATDEAAASAANATQVLFTSFSRDPAPTGPTQMVRWRDHFRPHRLVLPIATALALAIVIGAYAIVNGVFDIIEAIRHRGSSSMVLRIVLGVVSILFGILVLVWPGISLAILVIMVAIWAIMIGILQIVSSVGHRAVPNSGWVWGIIGGALSILFGILAA